MNDSDKLPQVKMTYGKRPDGAYVHIKNVQNGMACGCTCIECDKALVAKQGKVLNWHFAHIADTDCRGYKPETIVHYRAKHIFADYVKTHGLHSVIPARCFKYELYKDDDDYCRVVITIPAVNLDVQICADWGVHVLMGLLVDKNIYVEVEGKSPCGQYQPDVSIYPLEVQLDEKQEDDISQDAMNKYSINDVTNSNPLYHAMCIRQPFVGVEFVVTHDVNDDKLKKIMDNNDISIRVYLNKNLCDVDDKTLMKNIKDNIDFISYGEGHLANEICDMTDSQIKCYLTNKWICAGNVATFYYPFVCSAHYDFKNNILQVETEPMQ